MVDTTYYKQPTESIPEYNVRIANYNTTNANNPPQTSIAQDLAAQKPAATPAPTQSSPDYYSRYTPQEQQASTYLGTFQALKTADQIAQEKTQAAQGQIDSLNKYYDSLLAEQNVVNQGRERGTNAISVLNGLAGSSDAQNAANQTAKVNQRENDTINAQRGAAVQQIFSQIRTSAAQEAKDSREEARKSAEDILTARTTRATEANAHLTNLAKTGITAEGLKGQNPQDYDYLARQVGGEDQLKALFTLNRPQETVLDKRVEGGKYVIAYQNPITGKVRMESVDLGLPNGYSKSFDAGDRLLFAPDNWDGDPSKLVSVNKGLTPQQQQKATEDAGTGTGTAAPEAQTRLTEALTLAQELRKDTAVGKHGAVGASLQKLAIGGMSLGLQPNRAAFEAKVETLKSNLTLDNLKLLKGAMSDKDLAFLQSVGSSLDTSMSEKEFNAELDRVITKLQTATGAPAPSGSKVLAKDGQSFDASALTPEEYQQALKDGYVAQ